MKLLHLSDLHIGKRVFEFSMLEDQRAILEQILSIADEVKPDAVIIAGDVYDKSVPSEEAVQLCDSFLSALAERHLQTFIISGNHDSSERIAFGSKLMCASGIHLSPVYDGTVKPVTLSDEFGTVNFYLLPFIKPAHVRRYYEDEKIESYTDALRVVIEHMEIDASNRNVLVTHQFVAGASRCESEELLVGGTDAVNADIFSPFDYTALGHLHSPQNVGSKKVRYCGTPLAYSFSECGQQKSVSVVTLRKKGNLSVETIPLTPKRKFAAYKGSYLELAARDFYRDKNTEDYLAITLTDEQDIPNAMAKLRAIYPNLMRLNYDNSRTRSDRTLMQCKEIESKHPAELFAEFYENQNGSPMSEMQRKLVQQLIEEIWEEEA